MAKKTDKSKPSKKAEKGPKAPTVGIGHNSGKVVPGLIKIVDELLAFSEQKKSIVKAERDLRNQAKAEFGILAGPLAHELRLRKMDKDVRVQFEMAHQDLKTALGYQPELDFVNGTPTSVSARAQFSEAELQAQREESGDFDLLDDDDDNVNDNGVDDDAGRIERHG